ncbi:protein Gawky isoform X3 [Cylas formicarius]|uniref:protein Gawky isoform X3 n=1 Tax=Cylas formicarius TaxID=197179 RepID=UPI002958DF28|nr:protein Gawky isoform X3 [Cylas formicarius]
MMRAPTPSEPKSNTFPTYQVPQESAMRGSAPQSVQHKVARAAWGGRADPPTSPLGTAHAGGATPSVITGSSCRPDAMTITHAPGGGNSNVKMQSVTDNCLLNSVTVPKIQRNGRHTATHNNLNNNINSDKLDDSKFGALPLGRDIPNQKSDDLEVLDNLSALKLMLNVNGFNCDNNDHDKERINGDYDQDADYLCNKMQKLRTTNEDDDQNFVGCYAPLRLRGGGESSLSTGTSGWGTPPAQQAANNASGWGAANPSNQNNGGTQQWNNNANRPPASNQGQDANKSNTNGQQQQQQQPPTTQSNNSGWGQAGAKPPTGTNNGPATSSASTNNATPNNNNQNSSTTSTKQQLEQLNNMREAIFSQEGWGGQHVNQDTNWDIPPSPEPQIKMDGAGPPPWKPAVNNGTELWEANLRNGGQPPPQPQQKTPWGHTPSTNIGGTWGEDDDTTDSSNVWTGVPSNQQQWGNNGGNAMWGGAGAAGAGSGGTAPTPGWGDPRASDPRAAVAAVSAMDMRPDMRVAAAAAAVGNLDPRQLDPREQMRHMTGGGDMRGDPRGITGRLNGAGAEFWGQTGPLGGTAAMHHQNKMPGVGPGNGTAWDEPSPPSQRRTMPNYDDGTSLWGNPQPGSHWKDLPTGAGGMGGRGGGPTGPPGMAPSRGGGLKPDGSVWGGGPGGAGVGRGNGWDDVGAGPTAGGGGWDDPSVGPWPKQKIPGAAGGLWDAGDLDWGHKQSIKPQLTKEMVWNSKQFRTLVDMGHKKEDVENALRMREMNFDEALDMLSLPRNRTDPGWMSRHDDHYDHPQFPAMGAQRGFPNVGPANPLSNAFPPNNPPNLLNNMAGAGGQSNSSLINNISPAIMQKMLTQQGGVGGAAQSFGGAPAGGRPLQPQSQPSTQQLRMLVQQIQMAVQTGYLNHQILNQPLAPQTLVLLNQLLQQIKTLHQLNNQHQLAAGSGKGNLSNNVLLNYSVMITKTKQQILNIQNQIQAQQALYVKQQQNSGNIGYDSFKANTMHDTIHALQGNFAELGIAKESQVNQQQSRLNQWINKDKEENGEFSRAPGSSSKPVATSPNMAPLGLTQPDGPWSTGRTGDTGWPDSSGGDSSNEKDAQWATTAQPSLTDLVPEFEPGKPWKGNQIKIEDDPSITPGSVVRSPLSIATIKDNELFSMNTSKSPPVSDAMQSLSLSSSTWSFNPPSTSSAFTSSPQIKLPTSKGGLADLNPSMAITSELWGAPKSRGPPPGLSGKGGGGGGAPLANGWSSNIAGSVPWGGASGSAAQRNSGNWGVSQSQWLLLRNLTAQIDGSTLRTLCMQHGPLQSFHLHLHQGFALAKYSSREEATKAQTALNNCVLGNTTILAENPTDWDASTLLQSIANQQGASSGGWRASSTKPGVSAGDTWSTGWPNNPSGVGLWATTSLDSNDPARATPASLNSFLPNDLLGGESM